MKDEEKIDYQIVFKAVEEAIEIDEDMLFCSECHKGFYSIHIVNDDEPDYVFADKYLNENNQPYCCNDHVIYDLLIDPEVSEKILISKTIKKIGKRAQIKISKVDARLFLPQRLN